MWYLRVGARRCDSICYLSSSLPHSDVRRGVDNFHTARRAAMFPIASSVIGSGGTGPMLFGTGPRSLLSVVLCISLFLGMFSVSQSGIGKSIGSVVLDGGVKQRSSSAFSRLLQ